MDGLVSAIALPAAGTAPVLPALREDLRLFPAAPNRDGSPAWMIQDPVRNRFYRIGWLEFELLSRWQPGGNPGAVSAGVATDTPLHATVEDVGALAEFLGRNQLLQATSAQDSAKLAALRRSATANRLNWLAHHYLFFRVPLVHPAAFLERTLPWIRMLFTPAAALLVAVATIAGLMLAARQWDAFAHAFVGSLGAEGLVGYLAALAVAKSLHELGHAYTATRYGVRVGHMGIAFVVLWPMLYTDTGESWKLADRRQRFAIAAAGILAFLASLNLIGWNLP